MKTEHRMVQVPNDIVDVSLWEPDSEFPFGPQGAKPKRILICPTPAPHRFLIAGHRYLFKHPDGLKVQQIWSEIIAYEIARTTELPIPPAFAAMNSRDGSVGVLIEFFYGFWDEPRDVRFVDGRALFGDQRQSFDAKIGSLKQNLALSKAVKIPNALDWWGRAITFDALIGNTDRHSENWGFLIKFDENGPQSREMAPIFDNGTSLGQIIRDQDLPQFITGRDEPKLLKFLRLGRHHFSWLGTEGEQGFIALCAHFVSLHFTARTSMLSVIQLSDERIEEVLHWATMFDFPVSFTTHRATFLKMQLQARRDSLKAVLGG